MRAYQESLPAIFLEIDEADHKSVVLRDAPHYYNTLPSATNPISVGYAALWTALTKFPAFSAPGMVKIGDNCRINLQRSGFVPPTTAKDGDRPAAMLGEGAIQFEQQCNSLASEIRVGYPLQLFSDEYTIDVVNLLTTVSLQALKARGRNLGVDAIYDWKIQGNFKPGDPLIKGAVWSAALTILLTMKIPNTDLQATYT